MTPNGFAARIAWRGLALLACVFTVMAQAARSPQWTVVDLGVGGSWSEVAAINNHGDVAGYFRGAVAGQPYESDQAFLYGRSGLQALGAPNGPFNGRAFGMNDKGHLVGYSMNGDAVLYRDGQISQLGWHGEARDINRSGAIVGTQNGLYAVLWIDGVLHDLGSLGGLGARANGINDKNQVVGSATLPDGSNMHAFLWEGGVMRDLGTLGGPQSMAFGINSRGVVVGGSLDRDFGWAAFIWDGDMRRLFTLPGTHVAYAINDRNQVVGVIDDGSFLFDAGVVTRLDQLPEMIAAGVRGFRPADINDRGWIVGRGFDAGGRPRIYMLVPR